MDDLDILLSIIENPTRRRILEALVHEPHYPLQLSRELGLSQQGIMKHLKVLEEHDLVRSYSEDSDQGGPARKIYVPTTGMTITVDIGPGLFSTEIVTRTLEELACPEGPADTYVENRKIVRDKVGEGRERIADIDGELMRLGHVRAQLIHSKESVLNEACGYIESMVDDYHSRRVLYEYLQHPDMTRDEIARVLGMRDEDVQKVIQEFFGGE